MGTINYYTSDYITIGFDLSKEHIDKETGEDITNCIVQDGFEQAQAQLEGCSFYYYSVKITPGYYEGFSIQIAFNYPLYFDSYEGKRAAQRELTELNHFLLFCVCYCDCCAVWPGWCTTYLNNTDTLKAIKKAIAEMREEARRTPCYSRLPASERIGWSTF